MKVVFQTIFISLLLLSYVASQYDYGSGDEGSGSGSGSGSGEGTTEAQESTTEEPQTTTTTTTTKTTTTSTLRPTTLQSVTCCTPQQLGEIILLIIQLLIIEGIIAGPGSPVTVSTTVAPYIITTVNLGDLPAVPGAQLNQINSNQRNPLPSSQYTSSPSPESVSVPSAIELAAQIESLQPPIVDLRSGQSILFMDPFVPSNARFYRTPLFGGMADGLKIKVKRKNNNKFMIKIKKSSNLWRGSMKANNFKITLTGKEIRKLLRDKLKRTVNYNSKLYKCKIFKKCKKIICNMKTKHKCALKKKSDRTISKRTKLHKKKRKRRRLMKIKSGRQNSISNTTKHSLFKGSFLNFS